jgi:hypothetical protein
MIIFGKNWVRISRKARTLLLEQKMKTLHGYLILEEGIRHVIRVIISDDYQKQQESPKQR